VFYDRIKLYCNFMTSVSNEDSTGIVLTKNFQIIPISTEPGDVQLFSYLKPLKYEYNGA